MAQKQTVAPALYKLPDMISLFSRSRSWVLSQSKTDDFPKPVRLGKCLAWKRSEVDRYIDELPIATGGGMDAVSAARAERARQQA